MAGKTYRLSQIIDLLVEYGKLHDEFSEAATVEEQLEVVAKIRRETPIDNILGKNISDLSVFGAILMASGYQRRGD